MNDTWRFITKNKQINNKTNRNRKMGFIGRGVHKSNDSIRY
jgi:hypothetical protein